MSAEARALRSSRRAALPWRLLVLALGLAAALAAPHVFTGLAA